MLWTTLCLLFMNLFSSNSLFNPISLETDLACNQIFSFIYKASGTISSDQKSTKSNAYNKRCLNILEILRILISFYTGTCPQLIPQTCTSRKTLLENVLFWDKITYTCLGLIINMRKWREIWKWFLANKNQ